MHLKCSRSARPMFASVLAILVSWALAAPAASAQTTYSGQASAVVITNTTNPPGGITLCDTGPLPSTGGTLSTSLSNVNEVSGSILIDNCTADVAGVGADTDATTSITNLRLQLMPPASGGNVSVLSCNFAGGHANATAKSNGTAALSGDVNVQGLVVDGVAVTVTGKPNQVVNFSWGTITINKQTISGNTISVVALDIEEAGCMSGLFGVATAGIAAAGSPPPAECGKLTGGGWIVGTPGGGKGTFGVGGGIRFGQPWGHLEYIDHDTGMQVHATDTTSFTIDPNDSDCAIITYNVNVDGVSGFTATVHACDHGEPGRDDIFDIAVSNGYHAAGDLGGSSPGGGNIQMHKCPPGWMK